MSVTIRPASAADLPAVAAMVRKFRARWSLEEASESSVLAFLQHNTGTGSLHCHVAADDDGALVGYVLYTMSVSMVALGPAVNGVELWVDPAFREAGVARALIGSIEHAGMSHGARSHFIMVLETETELHDFYMHLGFARAPVNVLRKPLS